MVSSSVASSILIPLPFVYTNVHVFDALAYLLLQRTRINVVGIIVANFAKSFQGTNCKIAALDTWDAIQIGKEVFDFRRGTIERRISQKP